MWLIFFYYYDITLDLLLYKKKITQNAFHTFYVEIVDKLSYSSPIYIIVCNLTTADGDDNPMAFVKVNLCFDN